MTSRNREGKNGATAGSLDWHGGGAMTSDGTQPTKSAILSVQARRPLITPTHCMASLAVRRSRADRMRAHLQTLDRPSIQEPQSARRAVEEEEAPDGHPLFILLGLRIVRKLCGTANQYSMLVQHFQPPLLAPCTCIASAKRLQSLCNASANDVFDQGANSRLEDYFLNLHFVEHVVSFQRFREWHYVLEHEAVRR